MASGKTELDPKQIGPRLYNQVSALLTQLETGEHITLKERVQALVAIGRLQQIFLALRKGQPDDERAGSTVKKYATAFSAADAAGRRKAAARSKTRPEPADWFEHADTADDDDGDDITPS